MKINDIILDRFLNNDLSRSKINKIKLLIKKDPKLRSRVQELKSFESAYEKEYKIAKKTKMPKSLYEKISVEQNTKENYFSKKFNNFYKIAASILIIFSIGWVITLPNKTYLSQNPLSKINKSNHIHIFYDQKTLDEFLSKNDNCSDPEEIIDENNREVFAVSCKKD